MSKPTRSGGRKAMPKSGVKSGVKSGAKSTGNPHSDERRAAAEEIAIAALAFIASEPEHLGRFLAETGIGPQSIRDAARDPHFLAGVLDHVGADESLLLAFAAAHEVKPDEVMRARDVIGGRWERELP